MTNLIQITESQLEGYLNQGMTREQIATELDTSLEEVKEIFQSSDKLRHAKPRKEKVRKYVLVPEEDVASTDDTDNDVSEDADNTSEEAVLEAVDDTQDSSQVWDN